MKELLFGTAGIPLSAEPRTTIDGIKHVRRLGLGSMELEFVRSVNITKDKSPEVKKAAEENDVVLGALGKTSSMFTDNGNLLSAVLSGMGSPGSWIYYPIADIENCNHRAEIFFVKFHDKSKHVFRLEIFNVQKNKAEEAISMLAANSTDPIFIGYPYGLVEADRMARVSNNERESLKTMLLVKLRSRNIERYLSAANAHEILDRISF